MLVALEPLEPLVPPMLETLPAAPLLVTLLPAVEAPPAVLFVALLFAELPPEVPAPPVLEVAVFEDDVRLVAELPPLSLPPLSAPPFSCDVSERVVVLLVPPLCAAGLLELLPGDGALLSGEQASNNSRAHALSRVEYAMNCLIVRLTQA